MSRLFLARALGAVLTFAVAGCQDYNFNPVGHCLIQPGTERFTLSSVSTADVLFVVDDSGSMGGEQARLASAFNDFVQNLTSTNASRASNGLLPLDYHVAVTTTSIYWNPDTSETCSTCAGGSQLVCCIGAAPAKRPKKCSSDTQCTVAGTKCRNTCTGLKGEGYCCSDGTPPYPADTFPPLAISELVPCSIGGNSCGQLQTHYQFGGSCAPSAVGVAEDQFPYADGDFVSLANTAAGTANPRVLHFDKRLAQTGTNAQGFSGAQLEAFFEQNVKVGTCGSGEEQGLQAARLAVQKALARTQGDTWSFDPSAAGTAHRTFTVAPGIRAATSTAIWPNPNSKLVLVFVGDEDDCSSPADPSGGVVMLGEPAGADACTRDATTPAPLGNKEFQVSSFVDYFTSLGRPLGAAFIVSARSSASDNSCTGLSDCVPGICCDFACTSSPPYNLTNVCAYDVCGGQAPGTRFLTAAQALQSKGADVVVGSICDPNFNQLLNKIADIVKTPETLTLPTQPADDRITLLRIASSNGDTRKLCGAALAPTSPNYTLLQAQNTGADWWFTANANPGPPNVDPSGSPTAAAPSKFIYINPKGTCIANPGETYSADYLGLVPAGGCTQTPVTDPDGALDCQAKLGGQASAWECYVPPGLAIGTCTCKPGP